MDNLPKRDDDIYLDIEKFEDYELTDCIVYEMELRSKKVQDFIAQIITIYNDNVQALMKYYNTKDSSIYHKKKSGEQSSSKKLYYDGFDKSNILQNKFYDLYNTYKIMYKTKSLYYKVFGEKFYNIFNYYKNTGENRIEDNNEIGFSVDPDERETKLVSLNKKDGFYIKTLISTNFYSFDPNVYYDDNLNYDISKAEKDFKEYIKSEEGRFNIDYKNEIRIIDNFKRPKIEINELKANKIKIELNLNKSIDEVKAYIDHIYKNLENIQHKVPIELLGEKLQLSDNELCITKKRTKEEICFDTRNYLTTQDRIADMLFIYDATKQKMKQKDIKQSIDDYYFDRDLKETRVDPTKFVNKYLQIAEKYIDDLKYQELLTGIKNK